MITLTEHQRKIVEHNGGHALVIAGPGSGKTTALIERVYHLFEKQKIEINDICVLVFNRDIALKLKQDIDARFGGSDTPHSSTVHSFILSQTLKHGTQLLGDFEIGDNLGSLGMKEVIFKPITKQLKDKHSIIKTPDGKKLTIHYVTNKLWTDLRDYWLTTQEPTDSLFPKFKYEVERLKKILNIIFFDELAIKFLNEIEANSSFREAVKKGKVIIDEFQDLNPTEHALLKAFHDAGVEFMCFGDDDQAINEFRRANADLVQDFKRTYLPTEYPLPCDRRCPKEILALADSFVSALPGRLSKTEGHAPHQGKIDIIEFISDEQEKNNLSKIVSKFLGQAPCASSKPQVLILSGRVGGASNKSRIDEIVDVLKTNDVENVSSGEFRDPLDTQFGLALRGLLILLNKEDSSLGLYILLGFRKPKLIEELLQHIENEERKGNALSFFAASEVQCFERQDEER
jgi:superfamily I DNA/RNA helicase